MLHTPPHKNTSPTARPGQLPGQAVTLRDVIDQALASEPLPTAELMARARSQRLAQEAAAATINNGRVIIATDQRGRIVAVYRADQFGQPTEVLAQSPLETVLEPMPDPHAHASPRSLLRRALEGWQEARRLNEQSREELRRVRMERTHRITQNDLRQALTYLATIDGRGSSVTADVKRILDAVALVRARREERACLQREAEEKRLAQRVAEQTRVDEQELLNERARHQLDHAAIAASLQRG